MGKIVRDLRGTGPDLDEEAWYDSAIDEASMIISNAVDAPPPPPPPPPTYWARRLTRADLVEGSVYAHGTTRLNLAQNDLTAFVDPPDAGLMFGYRALRPELKSTSEWLGKPLMVVPSSGMVALQLQK